MKHSERVWFPWCVIRWDHFDVSFATEAAHALKGKWVETQGEGEMEIFWLTLQNRDRLKKLCRRGWHSWTEYWYFRLCRWTGMHFQGHALFWCCTTIWLISYLVSFVMCVCACEYYVIEKAMNDTVLSICSPPCVCACLLLIYLLYVHIYSIQRFCTVMYSLWHLQSMTCLEFQWAYEVFYC